MPTPQGKGVDVRFIGPVMGRYTLESRIRLQWRADIRSSLAIDFPRNDGRVCSGARE